MVGDNRAHAADCIAACQRRPIGWATGLRRGGGRRPGADADLALAGVAVAIAGEVVVGAVVWAAAEIAALAGQLQALGMREVQERIRAVVAR